MTRGLPVLLIGLAAAGQVLGQSTAPDFSVVYQLDDKVVHPLFEGSTINFPPIDFKTTVTASVAIVNQGTGAGAVSGITITGAGFRLTSVGLLPATVGPGQALSFGVVFDPGQAGKFNGNVRIDATGRSMSCSLAGSTAPANISLMYVDPVTGSAQSLQNGSTIAFPKTLANSASNITVLATNSGPGTGFLNSVTLGGNAASSFQLLSLPPFPTAVPPSQAVRFGVRFSPEQQQNSSATMTADLDGQLVTVNLTAQGMAPQFTYTCSDGANTTPLLAGGVIAIADTPVGQTTTETISIVNAGTADGAIPPPAVTGQGFSITGLLGGSSTLHPNDAQHFGLTFAPTQPGAVTGQLRIGSDTFTITGTGIGARLLFNYSNSVASTPVNEGQIVLFTPIAVGSTGAVDFSIQNTGTSAATLSSIGLTAGSNGFALRDPPGLPQKLDPGSVITFGLSFSPNNTGTSTAVLHVNGSSFTLWGTGTEPAALPSYRFQGPPGNPQPAQQPAVGLSLSSPYPLPLQGTLKLTFVSSVFTDDPAIQFASGGRVVKFNIPTNSTQALFNGGNATTIPLQTGTTAGDIVITPSFAMTGGFDLTPSAPPTLTMTIPRSAPQLLSAGLTARTANSFSVVLTGYVTSRSITQFDIQITPKQGDTISPTRLTVNVSSAAANWFQSAGSSVFGGAFQVTIPFVLGNGGTNEDLVQRLQSLSITATNEVGASSSLTAPIP